MNFTLTTLARSLAEYLKPSFGEVTFYEDPNQQDTKIPAMFLQQMYSETQRETGGCYLRKIGLDLTYQEDYNLPDLYGRYLRAAQILDGMLDSFPYGDGSGTEKTRLWTYERRWEISPEELHYKFEIQERVKLPVSSNPMERIGAYRPKVEESQ